MTDRRFKDYREAKEEDYVNMKQRFWSSIEILLPCTFILTVATIGLQCRVGDLIEISSDVIDTNEGKDVNIVRDSLDYSDLESRDSMEVKEIEEYEPDNYIPSDSLDISDNKENPEDILPLDTFIDEEDSIRDILGADTESDVSPSQDILETDSDIAKDTIPIDAGCTNLSIETTETSQVYVRGHKINSTRTYKQDIECVDDSEVVVSKKLVYDVFTASPPIQQGEIDKTLTIPWLDKNVQVTYYDPLSPSRIKMVSVIETQTLKNDNVYEIRGILIRVNEVNPGSVVLIVDGYEQTMSEGAYYIGYVDKYGLRVTNIDPTAQTVDVSILEPFIMSLSSGKYIKNEIGDKLTIDGSYWIVTDFETTNGITKIGAKRE